MLMIFFSLSLLKIEDCPSKDVVCIICATRVHKTNVIFCYSLCTCMLIFFFFFKFSSFHLIIIYTYIYILAGSIYISYTINTNEI